MTSDEVQRKLCYWKQSYALCATRMSRQEFVLKWHGRFSWLTRGCHVAVTHSSIGLTEKGHASLWTTARDATSPSDAG